jgi:hypothetical protein
LVGIAAAAYWGWVVGGGGALRWLLAFAAPAALIVVWGLFIAPRSRNRLLSERAKIAVGGALLVLAAGGLWAAGQQSLGLVVAGLVIVDTAALLALRA